MPDTTDTETDEGGLDWPRMPGYELAAEWHDKFKAMEAERDEARAELREWQYLGCSAEVAGKAFKELEAECEAVKSQRDELAKEVERLKSSCPDCRGEGQRWHAGFGMGDCMTCGGTGKRQ